MHHVFMLVLSTAFTGSVVDGVHLEILVGDIPAHNDPRINFWKVLHEVYW